MTISSLIEQLRQEHGDCCVTTNCRDGNCSLNLRGMTGDAMVIINGTKYQEAHPGSGRLCDRIIISRERGGFVCAVELKGGKSQPELTPIVEQVQSGLTLVDTLLPGYSPARWYPVLAFSGHMGPNYATALRSNKNRVMFRGERAEITRRDCGTQLVSILTN